MSKTNMKKIFLTLILSFTAVFVANGSSTSKVANAKYVPILHNICSLAVAPYNPGTSAILGSEATQYLNYLGTDTCNNFVKLFGNAYAPQPPKTEDNPIKIGAEEKNVPIVKHNHIYYNNTEQDSYYYKEFAKKFEITLQTDTTKNIDLSKIQCDTFAEKNYDLSKLSALINCSGSLDDLWGGTTITKTTTTDNKLIITWEFGTKTPTKLPQIWANNGADFDMGDFTNEQNRKFPFSVHLPTKDNGTIWSATTTSRVLLADMAIHKLNYAAHKNDGCVNNDYNNINSGWCYLDPKTNVPTKDFPTETVFTSTNHTYYWFPIGSVATVWKKFTPLNVCTELKATLDDKNPIKYNGKDAYPMSVNVIKFDPQNTIPKGAELKWTTSDPSGTFLTDVTIYPDDPTKPGVVIQKEIGIGSVNTSAILNKKTYYIGKAESKITVTLTSIPADQISAQCSASMTTPAVPECSDLLVDHPEKIYENTYSIFKAKALGTDNKDLTGKIKYSVDPGYGEFYVIAPKGIPANTSKTIFEATPTSQIVPFPDTTYNPGYKIDPTILIYGNPNNKIGPTFIDINTKIATGSFGIQDLAPNISDPNSLSNAVKNEIIFLPDWITSGLPPSTDPVDPFMNPLSDETTDSNPGKYQLNSVLDINIDPNKPVGTQGPSIQDIGTAGKQFNANDYFISTLFNSITVDPNTTVYFYAKKPGKAVIHVQVVGSANPDCSRPFDIEGQCKSLNLVNDPVSPLTIGQLTKLTVNPVDSTGKALPTSTNIQFTTTAGGTFNTTTLSNILAAKVSEFPVNFKDSNKAGKVTVTMDPTDPAYTAACKGEIEVVAPVAGVCSALAVKFNGNQITQLEKNTSYVISETITTTSKDAQKVFYKIDPNYGYFINMSEPMPQSPKTEVTVDYIRMQPLILKTKDYVPAQTGIIDNVLQVKVVGTGTECSGSMKFNNPAQVNLCTQITLSPNQESFKTSATMPDPTTFTIGGTNKEYKLLDKLTVKISSSITGDNGKPKISKLNNLFTSEITFDHNELQTDFLQFKYDRGTFTMNDDSLSIDITSSNPNGLENQQCKASINYLKSTIPTCQETGNCPPGPDITNPPTFSKVSYADHNIKDAGPITNIKRTTQTVTYAITLDTGNNITDATIQDLALKQGIIYKKGGQENCLYNIEGCLKFKGMEINWVKTDGGKIISKKTLYKDSSDKYKNESSKFDSEISDAETKDLNSSYEKNDCKEAKPNQPCINTGLKNLTLDSFSKYINSTFINGKVLRFENLSQLKKGDKIIVKYQMEYLNKESLNTRCQKYKDSKNGCGEQFDNKARADVTQKNGNKYPTMESSTKVIAICPYILSRQGGDVFFHDLVKTGVDVSQCYDVKSCDGPCIVPEPPEKDKIGGETGITDVKPSLLQSPSHDVCSASNTKNNLEGYNDVLTNFSSSICELQVDISKAWTKQNITDSINANVKRIARFDFNLNSNNTNRIIHSVEELRSISNAQSGVFIKTDGDLTIEASGTSGYSIESVMQDATTLVPAAQTYIVKGHDLHIKSNITYNSLGVNFSSNKTIPSAAFIVIDGNIIIDSNVTQIDGIIMAVDTDNRDTDGQNLNSEGVDGQIRANVLDQNDIDRYYLNINGNLIGNVLHLFTNRQYAGDPLKDEGSVNIHYDERILLNPPPGINELINLQQVVVPN